MSLEEALPEIFQEIQDNDKVISSLSSLASPNGEAISGKYNFSGMSLEEVLLEPPPPVFSTKATCCNHKELGSSSLPSSSPLKSEGLEYSLFLLSKQTELLQHSHHIVILMNTDNFPCLGPVHTTEPQLRIPTRRWNISRGHM